MMGSNYLRYEEHRNDGDATFQRCPRCKGSGIDPDCAKSYQDDEWDCTECAGFGDIEVR
jgi:hypothetical protein